MNILLVEDDPLISDVMAKALRQEGWSVDHVPTAYGALAALVEHSYSAVLLDLGLAPGASGMDVLRELRGRYDAVPVVIVTARDQLRDRLRGLDAGADDYLIKPFQIDELLARVRAVVRRSEGRVLPVLRWKDIELDPAHRHVTLRGEPIRLGTHEYRTLLALMERQGRSVARGLLESLVYGESGSIESNTIAVYIHQLRRKLGNDVISTVHGYGYRLGEER